VHVSDPSPKRWLADDPGFLASLGDLDRGLVDEREAAEDEPAAAVAPIASSPAPLRTAAPRTVSPPGPAAARAARPINAARALDSGRVLDPAPPARVPAPPRMMPPADFVEPDSISEPDEAAPPPLAFTRSTAAEPRLRSPLLDLFPPSALEAEGPPMPAHGTAVGPQLPPARSRPAPPPSEAPSPLDALTYEIFYGLHEKPFSLSTDPRFYYQSASHERAGQEILAAIRKHGGPAVLTAPLGMGKTTLCRSLVAEIDRRTVTSLVLDPIQSIDDLLKTMLVDFGVIARDDLPAAANVSRELLVSTLSAFLESLAGLDAGAVLFVDEAQNVPVSLLGDLAVLMGAPAARVLQLVLVGQPALTTVLAHRELRALSASVSRRTELGPLAADEIASYVMHRLSIAGANTRVEFDEAAIAQLFELSAGSPRVVNLLCDRAMSRGQAVSAAVIDVPLIAAAAKDLDLEWPEPDRPGALTSLILVMVFALLMIAGAAGALWVNRDAVTRTIQQWQNVPLPPGGPLRRLPVPLAPIPPPAGVQ
jgi:type II secretory pathway predicted ATPase ExeA